MDLLAKYIKQIESEILESEMEISSIERRILRLEASLKAPEKALAKEQKGETVRFKKISGSPIPKKQNNIFKRNQELKKLRDEKKTDEVPAAAGPAAAEVLGLPKKDEEKSTWSFFK